MFSRLYIALTLTASGYLSFPFNTLAYTPAHLSRMHTPTAGRRRVRRCRGGPAPAWRALSLSSGVS